MPNENVVRTEYIEYNVNHIFRLPSVETYKNPLIQELIADNLVIVEELTQHIEKNFNLEVFYSYDFYF